MRKFKVRASSPESGDELRWRCNGCGKAELWGAEGICPDCGAQLDDEPVIRLVAEDFGHSFALVVATQSEAPWVWIPLVCPSCGETAMEVHGRPTTEPGYDLEARCTCGLVAACEPAHWVDL